MGAKRSAPIRWDHPWLVVHDTRGTKLIECSYHLTGARTAFLAKLDALRFDGWTVEGEASPRHNLAFCHRGSVRIQVSLVAYDPNGPGPGSHELGSAAPKRKLQGDILIRCKRCGHTNVMAWSKWEQLGGEKALKRLRCSQCDWSCAVTVPLAETRPDERVVPFKRRRKGQ